MHMLYVLIRFELINNIVYKQNFKYALSSM